MSLSSFTAASFRNGVKNRHKSPLHLFATATVAGIMGLWGSDKTIHEGILMEVMNAGKANRATKDC